MEPSFIEGGRWIRGGDDIALRLRLDDPPRQLAGGIAVEPGVVALVLEAGAVREEIAPGDYALEALLSRLGEGTAGKAVDLALISEEARTLAFAFEDVAAKNGELLALAFDVQTEIASSGKLVTRLLRDPGRLTRSDLIAHLRPGVREAADQAIGRESADASLGPERLAAVLESGLISAGARLGLRVVHLENVVVRGEIAPDSSEGSDRDVVWLEEEEGDLELSDRRDLEQEQRLEQGLVLDGISADALAAGAGVVPSRMAAPPPGAASSVVEASAPVRCSGCGVPARGSDLLCRACGTPL